MSVKKYDDLDFLLNIYYDLIYHKTPEKNYKFEPISRKSIQLIDLKKPTNYDGSYILDADLKYLGHHNGRIHFKRKLKTGYPCQLSIGIYDNINNTNMSK